MASQFKEVYRLVRKVPRGSVSTYGDIAALCKGTASARTVGWAMSAAPSGVPWHRVVNHQGRLSIGKRSVLLQELQKDLLEAEGISFKEPDRVDLDRHRWNPRIPTGCRQKKPKSRKN